MKTADSQNISCVKEDFYVSHKTMIEDIEFEIDEIDNELNAFSSLLELCEKKNPDTIEKAALGSLLHAFYTGIEKIFSIIAKKIDGELPSKASWHKDLLTLMSKPYKTRNAVISRETFTALIEYLNFRHYFRHAYEYRLDWEMMQNMVLSINKVWDKCKNDIRQFINSISDKRR